MFWFLYIFPSTIYLNFFEFLWQFFLSPFFSSPKNFDSQLYLPSLKVLKFASFDWLILMSYILWDGLHVRLHLGYLYYICYLYVTTILQIATFRRPILQQKQTIWIFQLSTISRWRNTPKFSKQRPSIGRCRSFLKY